MPPVKNSRDTTNYSLIISKIAAAFQEGVTGPNPPRDDIKQTTATAFLDKREHRVTIWLFVQAAWAALFTWARLRRSQHRINPCTYHYHVRCGIIFMVLKDKRHDSGGPGGGVGTSSLKQNVVPSRKRTVY